MTPIIITHQISDRRIADLLCGAFEGGSNYWIQSVKAVEPVQDGKPWDDEYTPSYIRAPFSTGGHLEVYVNEDDFSVPIRSLNRAALAKGLTLMAEHSARHFNDFLNDADDADAADVFLQYCLFGDVIFS